MANNQSQQVRDLMTPNPILVSESTTVQEAAQAMRQADVGDVLVMRDHKVRGIVTDRDITVRFVAGGRDPARAAIVEICSPDLTVVEPDHPIADAVALMRDNAIRRLPVVEDGTAVGIVSLGDIAALRDPSSVLARISTAPGNT
jgi:CBS domain-containing protein